MKGRVILSTIVEVRREFIRRGGWRGFMSELWRRELKGVAVAFCVVIAVVLVCGAS